MEIKSVLELRAGPLSMTFDPSNAFIRHMRWGGQELVRAIYGAVRDQNWATIPSVMANLKTEVGSDSFRISFDVVCRERAVDYAWRGTIRGEASGKVTYMFDGEARSNFQRNRIGLCVLHPIEECAGRPCMIEHVDGSREMGTFPKAISPEQPFFDIHAVNYGALEIRFDGETFEMEDQRNWGDASYKTYSTPQRLPKPAAVRAGDQVRHEVTVRLHDDPYIWIADGPRFPFPQISTGAEPDSSTSPKWFADLNMSRPAKDSSGMLVYAATPHVHQPDDTTMIENIAGIAAGPETAKEFSSKPVVISPITVQPSRPQLRAPWTLGLISRLAQTGNVHSMTFAQPLDLDFAGFKPAHVLATRSSHPLLAEALAMVNAEGRRRVMVGSFVDRPLKVRVGEREATLQPFEVRTLND
jgi:hypothetical protein